MVGAVLVVKIFETIFGGILGPALKNSIFVSAWTAITSGLGIHDIKKGARNLRKSDPLLKKRPLK